jgi:RNA polymerase-binding transcription factor DksA
MTDARTHQLDAATLGEITTLLEERRTLLLSHLRLAEGDIPDDAIEDAQELSQAELARARSGQTRAQLEETQAALDRLDAGTYGRCDGCGAAIPAERLRALPHTATCTGCAR